MKVRTCQDIKQLGTILGIWAHPDDETFSCACIMAAAIQNKQVVACLTATKGEAGVQDPKRWPPDKLGDIRMKEMAAALAEMGIKNHHWLNYPDGGCSQVDCDEAAGQVQALIKQYQPQTVLTFGPDGMTGHPDHQIISHWAHLAAQKSGLDIDIYHAVQSREMYDRYLKSADEKFNIFFNIDEPPLREQRHCDICFQLSPKLLGQKIRALEAMPSQTEAMIKNTSRQELLESFGVECFELYVLESV